MQFAFEADLKNGKITTYDLRKLLREWTVGLDREQKRYSFPVGALMHYIKKAMKIPTVETPETRMARVDRVLKRISEEHNPKTP